ncbi:late competence development ComFB family protein [Paucibacter sediminis]|uniref:Late competence development ComFB family protein n=1 Tax=Paucibacter sediminis TaxID=3019553 RepID=A0AA95SP31_9BURK|nr:late competence development ComFB family protein [Paucibacter sp. S2-9]WIT10431.1 late competence development ComFB family protein [Paucibacter sp. S2-9]
MQTVDFTSLYNHHEREVFAAVMQEAPRFPAIEADDDLLCDVACVALNRLPPRYIRHAVDFSFYLTEPERLETDAAIAEAVSYAFNFVQARTALRAKKR